MDHFIITGTSRGIGKAIAEEALKRGHSVTGISRGVSIDHPAYEHQNIDLSEPEAVSRIKWPSTSGKNRMILVNNAGMIGNVKKIGRENDHLIIKTYHLNLIAVHLMMNHFLKNFQDFEGQKIVMNVSSGAGKYPVDGWSEYCSSKAGVEMLTAVAAGEARVKNEKTIFYSISPGVVDTSMQDNIRKAELRDFPRLNDFIAYKRNNELSAPGLIASKIFTILENTNRFPGVSLSLREVEVN